jgi:hypothetical protein
VKYLLLIAGNEQKLNSNDLPEADVTKRGQEWASYTQELVAANKIRGGERLRPIASATTVRQQNGQRLISDGPFAETKEQLGGFYLIDANDLDEAVDWASKMPHLADGGSVEIRPVWEL